MGTKNNMSESSEKLIALLSSLAEEMDAIGYLSIGKHELVGIEFEVLGEEYFDIRVNENYYAVKKFINYENKFYIFEYSCTDMFGCSFEGWYRIVNYVPAKVEY